MFDKSSMFKYFFNKEKEHRELKEHMADTSSIGDMAFLLLVFFIVTGSFMVRQGVFFSLPSKSASSVKIDEKDIIEITPKNDCFILENKKLNRLEVSKYLAEKSKQVSTITVIIKMHEEVNYARLVDIVSITKESGITRVSLRNLSEES